MNQTIYYIILFIIGLAVGSFLNVCIYRIPRNTSIVFPSSRCPACNTPIIPRDNFPVLSYLLLAGRCRFCKEKISLRYPVVESINAILYITVLWRFGPGWHTFVYCGLCSALVVITFIDLDFQIIPDRITLPALPVGLITGSFLLPDPFLRDTMLGIQGSFIGLATGGGLFYAIAVLSRGGMGGGDVKMMAMVGAFMGWKSVLLTTFVGSLVGSVLGIFLILFKGKGRKTKIPFGPFLAFGTLVTLFSGQELLDVFLSLYVRG